MAGPAAGVRRREVLRGAALLGLGGGACRARAAGASGVPRAGAVLRIAQIGPAGRVDPVTAADTGALVLLQQAAEFLLLDAADGTLRPMLATAWAPNADGSVWEFSIRDGVRFHSGRVLRAADVAATMNRLANPANGSNALSVFRGVLSPGGAVAVDERTVRFTLDAPNGNFPYCVSSDNYNAVILPEGAAPGFAPLSVDGAGFDGTGPFRLAQYVPQSGCVFVRNAAWWGGEVLPARLEFAFHADQQPQVLAMQGGDADLMQQLVVQGGQALLDDPGFTHIAIRSTAQRLVHLRCDRGPFADRRVRQAMALAVDRAGIVAGPFRGLAQLGNDSPFAPSLAVTDPGVAQRRRDVGRARALMAEAGHAGGIDAVLVTEQLFEIADYAAILAAEAAEVGIRLRLRVEDVGAYYGAATFGRSDWLDSDIGITDYGHRGTPDVMLQATLRSGGPWNASRFADPVFDALAARYVAALEPEARRGLAGDLQRLLLEQTPAITGYFYDYLVPMRAGLAGVEATAQAQLFLAGAGFA